MINIFKKTGWKPAEIYFNDINAEPPVYKESALKRFIFPKHGNNGSIYYAVESNPKTRAMYSKYGIAAQPYDKFIKGFVRTPNEPQPDEEIQAEQISLF